jgi:hypothetical protein
MVKTAIPEAPVRQAVAALARHRIMTTASQATAAQEHVFQAELAVVERFIPALPRLVTVLRSEAREVTGFQDGALPEAAAELEIQAV